MFSVSTNILHIIIVHSFTVCEFYMLKSADVDYPNTGFEWLKPILFLL